MFPTIVVNISGIVLHHNLQSSNLFKVVQSCSNLFKTVQTCSNLFISRFSLSISFLVECSQLMAQWSGQCPQWIQKTGKSLAMKSSELRCTRQYLTGSFVLICWTKDSFCGNLVSTKGMSQREYKLVPFCVHGCQIPIKRSVLLQRCSTCVL